MLPTRKPEDQTYLDRVSILIILLLLILKQWQRTIIIAQMSQPSFRCKKYGVKNPCQSVAIRRWLNLQGFHSRPFGFFGAPCDPKNILPQLNFPGDMLASSNQMKHYNGLLCSDCGRYDLFFVRNLEKSRKKISRWVVQLILHNDNCSRIMHLCNIFLNFYEILG